VKEDGCVASGLSSLEQIEVCVVELSPEALTKDLIELKDILFYDTIFKICFNFFNNLVSWE
jgi:hypothetical protein